MAMLAVNRPSKDTGQEADLLVAAARVQDALVGSAEGWRLQGGDCSLNEGGQGRGKAGGAGQVAHCTCGRGWSAAGCTTPPERPVRGRRRLVHHGPALAPGIKRAPAVHCLPCLCRSRPGRLRCRRRQRPPVSRPPRPGRSLHPVRPPRHAPPPRPARHCPSCPA
jgi:hypothetical protein